MPDVPRPPTTGVASHSRQFFIIHYALAMLNALRALTAHETSGLDMFLALSLNLNLALWAIRDGRARGRPLPLFAQPWYLFFALLLVPLAVINSRRWWGVLWVVLHAALWLLLFAAVWIAGGLLLYGEDWLRALV